MIIGKLRHDGPRSPSASRAGGGSFSFRPNGTTHRDEEVDSPPGLHYPDGSSASANTSWFGGDPSATPAPAPSFSERMTSMFTGGYVESPGATASEVDEAGDLEDEAGAPAQGGGYKDDLEA